MADEANNTGDAPGWDAIDAALRPVYGDREPYHFALRYRRRLMHRLTAAMCLLALAAGLSPALGPQVQVAQKALQGTWAATAAQSDGKPADDVVGHRLSFMGDRFRIQDRDGKTLYEGTFRVDPGAKPGAIDFEHTGGPLKGKAWKGIFALDGDTLRTCDNAPDLAKGRPAAFEAKSGSGYVFITFKRVKP
jgi:uncharacterized protein (TIGR03067 family)